MNEKKQLRAALQTIAITDPHRQSKAIISHLRKCLEQEHGIIACYCAMPDEVELAALWNDRREQFVFPRIEKKLHRMAFYTLGKRGLLAGAYGILEPNEDAIPMPPEKISLVICPGIAFSKNKIRLGRGAGYYDRWLAQFAEKKPKLIGVCFRERLVPTLPAETHDVPMDYIITPDGVI